MEDILALSPMEVGGVEDEEGMTDALESTVIALIIESVEDARAISTSARSWRVALILLEKVVWLLHASDNGWSRLRLNACYCGAGGGRKSRLNHRNCL